MAKRQVACRSRCSRPKRESQFAGCIRKRHTEAVSHSIRRRSSCTCLFSTYLRTYLNPVFRSPPSPRLSLPPRMKEARPVPFSTGQGGPNVVASGLVNQWRRRESNPPPSKILHVQIEHRNGGRISRRISSVRSMRSTDVRVYDTVPRRRDSKAIVPTMISTSVVGSGTAAFATGA